MDVDSESTNDMTPLFTKLNVLVFTGDAFWRPWSRPLSRVSKSVTRDYGPWTWLVCPELKCWLARNDDIGVQTENERGVAVQRLPAASATDEQL